MLIYTGEFISYGPIMGYVQQMCIPGWLKNWVIGQWWMAHSFRRSTWPVGHSSAVCPCCSWNPFLTQHLLCKLFPPVIVGFAWRSSNSWAPLWSVICQAQMRLRLTPSLETNQVSHTFNLTFGKAWIPFRNRVANGFFRLKELAMQLNRSKRTKPELRATPWGRCGWCKDE